MPGGRPGGRERTGLADRAGRGPEERARGTEASAQAGGGTRGPTARLPPSAPVYHPATAGYSHARLAHATAASSTCSGSPTRVKSVNRYPPGP